MAAFPPSPGSTSQIFDISENLGRYILGLKRCWLVSDNLSLSCASSEYRADLLLWLTVFLLEISIYAVQQNNVLVEIFTVITKEKKKRQ